MPVTCSNEMVGQSASSTSVYHLTSQRRTEKFYCFITRYWLAVSIAM